MNPSEQAWLGIGFIYFCKAVAVIAPSSYEFMFAVVAAITIYCFYKAIDLNSRNRAFSLLIFISTCLYYQCFNQARQMMALSICAVAYYFLCHNKRIKFFLVTILASAIHNSALVILILLLVRKWRVNFKNITLYCLIGLILYFEYDKLMLLLSVTQYGIVYVGSTSYDISFSTSSIINTIFRITLLIFCLLFYKKTIERNPSVLVLYNAAIICTGIQIFTIKSYFIGRITTYFFLSYIFLLPEIFKTIIDYFVFKDRIIIVIMFLICLIMYHYLYYMGMAELAGYNVYRTIFN